MIKPDWNWKVFGLIFLLCGGYLLAYPLHGSLPGNHDSWANLAMFETLRADVQTLFGGKEVDFGYPGSQARLNYGLDYFSGVFYLLIQWVLGNEVWSYCFFICLLLSLNGFAWFGLMRTWNFSSRASLVSACLLLFNPFVLGNLDNPNFLAFFPGFFGLGLLRLARRGNTSLVGKALFFLCLQFLLNPYGAVLMAVWIVLEIDIGFLSIAMRRPMFHWLLLLLPAMLLFFGYASYYLNQPEDLFNPVLSLGSRPNVLDMQDWWNSLPGTLINFPPYHSRYQNQFLDQAKIAFPGFGLLILGLPGILTDRKNRLRFLLLFGIGLFLSSMWFEITLTTLGKNPMDFFLFKTFRIPFRFYLLCIFAGCWGAARLLDQLQERITIAWMILSIQCLSLPIHREYFPSAEVLRTCREIATKVKDYPGPVLHLPSQLFTESGDKNEYRYMYLNALAHQVMYNGNFAFFTPERMQTEALLKQGLGVFLRREHPGLVVVHHWIGNQLRFTPTLDSLKWRKVIHTAAYEGYLPPYDSRGVRKD